MTDEELRIAAALVSLHAMLLSGRSAATHIYDHHWLAVYAFAQADEMVTESKRTAVQRQQDLSAAPR